MAGDAGRQAIPEELAGAAARRGAAFGFDGIPLFPPRPSGAAPIRPKLEIGAVDDPAEHEADRIADHVMRMPDPAAVPLRATPASPLLRRMCDACAKDEQPETAVLRRRPAEAGAALARGLAPPGVHQTLAAAGRPLPAPLRAFYEPRFGADLGGVRLHDDAAAHASARAVGAMAYTVGQEVVFRDGAYAPGSTVGRKLLAHELAHTLQQRGSAAGLLQRQFLEPPIEPPVEIPFDPAFDFEPEIEFDPEIDPELDPEIDPEIEPDVSPEGQSEPDLEPAPSPEPAPQPGASPQPEPFPVPYPVPQPQPPPDERRDPECGSASLPVTKVQFSAGPMGQGGTVIAQPLTKCPGAYVGSLPSPRIYQNEFRCIAAAGETFNWVRAHLLHGRTRRPGSVFNLHGPGNFMWNLIIADKALNGSMNQQAEIPARNRIWGHKEVLWYESRVDAYVPGLDAFAQSITVNFGHWNIATGSRGPRLGGGTFRLARTPPNCPTVASTAGIAPPMPTPRSAQVGAGTDFLFLSTLQLCRELTSRSFRVPDGGLEVHIGMRRTDAAGHPVAASQCAAADLTVHLERAGTLWGFNEVNSTTVPGGRASTLRWRHLPDDTYRLRFEKAASDPDCCLAGDIFVGRFHAPRPAPMRPGDLA